MSKISLQTLTPIILDDEQKDKLNYSNYETVLDDIMSDDKYCNIALTGGYGAGKSTILNTYEKEHAYKSIHVSLAKLTDEKTENVQAKLINQIIHQIDSKLIPQTQFKIKKIVDLRKISILSSVLFLFITSVLYLLKVPASQVIPNTQMSLYDTFWQYEENVWALVIALITFMSLLIYIVNAQLKRPLIKSIQMDKSQIELVESENDQEEEKEKFDKYMDEIIYLFEKSDIDIFVIEDLDRLEDVTIFYELRQINYLVNKKLGKKKYIRFIYMVRDELFKKNEERTKFFDIIIPIVPVMDNSNAYDLLKKMIGEEWLGELDEKYLKMICMYIRDYRMLKNIFNEFQIYYTQLKIKEYQYDSMKLFIMITYKNLFASDFADLQQGKGIVYNALKSIEEVRGEAISNIDAEIDVLKREMALIQAEFVEDLDELDAIYFEKVLGSKDNTQGFYSVDGRDEHSFESRVDFIRSLKKSNNVNWNKQGYYQSISISRKEIEEAFDELESNDLYKIRKERLLKNNELELRNIEKKIAEKREQKKHMQRASFKELTVNGASNCLANLFVADMELIKIFVQDEMITEDYASYMTYFYPYSISNEELRYLNKVFSRTNDDEQSEIIMYHPDAVIEYLKAEDWDSIALPNKSLFKYIVQRKISHLPKLIHNLKIHSNVKFAADMIYEFERKEDVAHWANELIEQWDDFIEAYVNSNNKTKAELFETMINLLDNLKSDKIPLQYVNKYFQVNEDLVAKNCDDRIIKILERVNYKFVQITKISKYLLERIYSRNLYQLNKENVDLIVNTFYKVNEDDDINKMHFSTIVSNETTPLSIYVHENIEKYLSEIYIPYYASNSTEFDVIINFLNHDDVSFKNKLSLVEVTSVVFDDINKVKSVDVRNKIVEYNKMKFSRSNILAIWEATENISVELCEFLKYHYMNSGCDLTFAYARKYFNESNDEHLKASKFIKQLLELENLEDAYDNLVRDVNIQYPALTSIMWSKEQISSIVKTRIILMTEKNLLLMRKYEDKDIFYIWVLNQIHVYLKLMQKEELRNEDELQTLISSEDTSDVVKIICIRMCTTKVHVHKSYNTDVVETIFKNDLFDGDFVPIIRRYNSKRYSKNFMSKLGSYVVTYISHAILMHFPLPYEILKYVMQNDVVTAANKKKLLAVQLPYLKLDKITECLRVCGEKTLLDAFDGLNPKVDATEENRLLLEALTKNKWLSSFKVVEEQYIVYPKKSIKKENVVGN